MSRRLAAVVAASLVLSIPASADMKAKTRMTVAGRPIESTNYVKGARQRTEMQLMPGYDTVQIYQCDLKRMVTLNPKNKTYMITELGETESTETPSAITPQPKQEKKEKAAPQPNTPGGTITISVNSTDTGERKDFFGYKARHVKTEMSSQASADAKCGANMNMKTDGWYIDFEEQRMNCTQNPRAAMASRGDGGGQSCNDKIRFKTSGSARLGYPVSTEMTMAGANGQAFTMKQETLELTKATLDQALFEIPPGYREVKTYQDLMGFHGIGGMIAAGKAAASMAAETAAANTLGTATSASTPKAAGKVRIGVLRFANSANATVSDSAFRDRLVGEIASLNMEAVPLDVAPRAPRSQIEDAAKQAQCDYFLTTDVSQFKDARAAAAGKKAFGGFLSRATGVDTSSATKDGGFTLGLDYKLFAMNDEKAHLEASGSSSEGSTAEATAEPLLEKEAMLVAVQVKKDAELRRRMAKK